MTMMKKKTKKTKIIKLDVKFFNPNLIYFLTILCQITISFKYWVTVEIGIKFRPHLFRLYLDRV
jgi:hypothetical protein